jgi:hypothetical protein
VGQTSSNGNTISWLDTGLVGATYYLYEATDAGFTQNIRLLYSGPNSSFTLANKSIGIYYYRVRTEKDGYSYSQWEVGQAPWTVTQN